MPAQVAVKAAEYFGLDETGTCFCTRFVPRLAGAPAQPQHGLPPGYAAPEGYTSLDCDVMLNALLYQSVVNPSPTAFPTNMGLEVDSVDTTFIFPEVAQLQRERVEAGRYDGSLVHSFAFMWEAYLEALQAFKDGETTAAPDLDNYTIPLLAGRLGKADMTDDDATFEILSWAALLNTATGRTTGEFCNCARLGRGRCLGEEGKGVDITQHGRTVAGVVAAPPLGQSAHSMGLWLSLAQPRETGWADFGVLRIASGPNRGVEVAVKRFHASGEITLRTELGVVPEPGTQIELEEGCDRLLKTCISKQPDPDDPQDDGNSLRFQGFDPPGQEKLVKSSSGKKPTSIIGGGA